MAQKKLTRNYLKKIIFWRERERVVKDALEFEFMHGTHRWSILFITFKPYKGSFGRRKKKTPYNGLGVLHSDPPIRLSQFQFQESEFCRCNAVGNYKTRCSLISFVVPNNFQEELTPWKLFFIYPSIWMTSLYSPKRILALVKKISVFCHDDQSVF